MTWDVSNVDTSKPGEYTVTGTVDTIGANENHWKWTNAAGESKTDEDDLINSGANANNSWKQTGGLWTMKPPTRTARYTAPPPSP